MKTLVGSLARRSTAVFGRNATLKSHQPSLAASRRRAYTGTPYIQGEVISLIVDGRTGRVGRPTLLAGTPFAVLFCHQLHPNISLLTNLQRAGMRNEVIFVCYKCVFVRSTVCTYRIEVVHCDAVGYVWGSAAAVEWRMGERVKRATHPQPNQSNKTWPVFFGNNEEGAYLISRQGPTGLGSCGMARGQSTECVSFWPDVPSYSRTQVATYRCILVPDTALAQRAVWAASPPCFPGQFLFLGSFLSHGFDRDAAAPAVQTIEVPRALVPNLLTGIFPVSRLFPVFRENDGQSWNELKRSLCLSRNIFDLAALPQNILYCDLPFLFIIKSTITSLKHQS